MKRTEVKRLYRESGSFGGQTVTVAGWIRTIRSSKSFGFIELNDGSFFKNLQIVFEQDRINNYNEIEKLNVRSAIIVTGVLELLFLIHI